MRRTSDIWVPLETLRDSNRSNGHLPLLLQPMLSAAIVLIVRTAQGGYPTPSIPYTAWGYTPVVYSALAFLLFLFNDETLLFLVGMFDSFFNGDHGAFSTSRYTKAMVLGSFSK